MPTKVAFDNNFLDAFVGADVATREAIFLCVQLGHLEMYASYEMLREVMGLAVTTRKDKIIPFARDILRLTQGKVLRLADAQESELRGSFELLMEEGARKQIVEFLQQAAGGHIPVAAATIGQGAIDEKAKAKVETDAWYDTIVKRAAKLNKQKRKAATYEVIQRQHWENTGRATVVKTCENFGIKEPNEIADRVVANPDKYPHTRFLMRVFAVMMHKYFIEGSRRDANDLYDLWQMSYLVDMDVFVTNEKKLPGWYADVFGPAKRVLRSEEFLSQAWC
jgi:hypothetical protein